MAALEVSHVTKSYADKVAVNDLSFTINEGEIFGLIGPNGAGKTTTIRMMMEIIKPDAGSVSVFGEKITEATKNRLGYMPEERGLYRKLRVLDTIVYLASLKGMDRNTAEAKALKLLDQTGMTANRNKKIEELSKGMAQLIQFIVTIVHEPELIILDEPFIGLDPVNTELSKQMITDLRDKGRAVILSTHQMNQVEELCDRILMVNRGRAVLYGGLAAIKARYRNNAILVDVKGDMGEIPGVVERRPGREYIELVLDGKTKPQQVLETLVKRGVTVNRFEIATPPLNEIFLEVAGKDDE
jgi:ABC-2 type transport system ATP-binding protein